METTVGTFRVYRVLDAVLHLNLFEVASERLYTVYQTGYDESLQSTLDEVTTGDLVEATVEGDPENADEPWRVTAVDRDADRSVTVDFAAGVDYPNVARETWSQALAEAGDDPVRPTGRALGTEAGDTAAGEVWVQPRDAVPDSSLALTVLAGRLPLEPWLTDLPYADAPTAELLVVDSDGPETESHAEPYGVFLFFTETGRALADRYRERWDLPRGADSRPDVDPY